MFVKRREMGKDSSFFVSGGSGVVNKGKSCLCSSLLEESSASI